MGFGFPGDLKLLRQRVGKYAWQCHPNAL